MRSDFVNAYVEGEDLWLFYRADNGTLKRITRRAEYSCFVVRDEVSRELWRQLENTHHVIGMSDEGKYRRIRFRDAESRKLFVYGAQGLASFFDQNQVKVYEGDVHPIRRFFSDTGAKVQMPKWVYLDIETDSTKTFEEARAGRSRVLSYSVIDADGTAIITALEEETDAAERAFLEGFWRDVEPFDLLLAWSGDDFDFQVLKKRSVLLGVQRPDERRWLYLDHLALFEKMNKQAAASGDEKQSLKLDAIGHYLLGEGKEREPGLDPKKTLGAQTYEMWKAGGKWKQVMLRYNLQDTDLLRKIEKKTGYLALFLTICDLCRLFPETRSLDATQQIDGFMLRMGVERDYRFPTRKYFDGPLNKYDGAYVKAPTLKGIGTDVHVTDFKSMYPSIIVTWNMSPDTKRPVPENGPIPEGHCRTPTTRLGFTTAFKGILTEAVEEVLRLRDFWNKKKASLPPGTTEWDDADRRAKSYKVVANSFYGAIGSPFSRHFDSQIAEGITLTGVWLLKQSEKLADAKGWSTVYADTDSLFVCGPTDDEFRTWVKHCNSVVYPQWAKDHGCIRSIVETDYEKKFARLVMVTAKKYTGWYSHYKGKVPNKDSKPEVRGLEWRRGDSTLLTRRLQWEVIVRLTRDAISDPYLFVPVIEEAQRHVLDDKLPPEEVIRTAALNKRLRDYATKVKKDGTQSAQPMHVRVAHMLKARGQEVREGIRVEFFVTDGAAKPQAVAPAEDYDGTNMDRFYIWDKQVWTPTESLLKAAFPEYDWSAFKRTRPVKPGGYVKVQLQPGLVRKLRTARAPLEGQEALFGAPVKKSDLEITPPPVPVPTRPKLSLVQGGKSHRGAA